MKEQLKTNNEGYLANPLNKENQAFGKWTHNFSEVPDFRFPDLFNYLVGKDPGYNAESLKSYKSLLGCKLYFDGLVEDLCYHPPQSSASSYSYFLFAVKPTERSKADDGSATYKGFFYFKEGWKCAFSLLPMQRRVCIFIYSYYKVISLKMYNEPESFEIYTSVKV